MADAATYKVQLKGPNDAKVIFEASAPLSESRQAEYDGYGIIHLPTSLLSYRRTTSRTFQVNGKLVSRTADEANMNVRYLDTIRRWVLPDFGGTGATPPILTLYGYNNKNIDGKRVVLKSYSWSFPEEVDYVFTGDQPMPVIGNIELSLEEIYSAEEVTSGAWRLYLNDSQVVTTTGKKVPYLSDSFKLTNGDGWWLKNGPTGPTPPEQKKPTTVANALQKKPVTVAGVIAGKLARTVGTAALNSPAVRAVTNRLPPVLKNVFVGGANIAINEAGKTVTNTVSSSTQPSTTSSFGRTTPLPAPTPIGPTGGS